jgi:hypothetical protein
MVPSRKLDRGPNSRDFSPSASNAEDAAVKVEEAQRRLLDTLVDVVVAAATNVRNDSRPSEGVGEDVRL